MTHIDFLQGKAKRHATCDVTLSSLSEDSCPSKPVHDACMVPFFLACMGLKFKWFRRIYNFQILAQRCSLNCCLSCCALEMTGKKYCRELVHHKGDLLVAAGSFREVARMKSSDGKKSQFTKVSYFHLFSPPTTTFSPVVLRSALTAKTLNRQT